MVEIGQFKSIAPNVSIDRLLNENSSLKNRQGDLKLAIFVTTSIALIFAYLYVKSKNNQVRIKNQENEKSKTN